MTKVCLSRKCNTFSFSAISSNPPLIPPLSPFSLPPPSAAESWCYGLLCVTLISLMSVLGVCLLPMMSKKFYRKLLSALIGLAVGSLIGRNRWEFCLFISNDISHFCESALFKNLSRVNNLLNRSPCLFWVPYWKLQTWVSPKCT